MAAAERDTPDEARGLMGSGVFQIVQGDSKDEDERSNLAPSGAAPSSKPTKRWRSPWVWVGVGSLLVVALVVAIGVGLAAEDEGGEAGPPGAVPVAKLAFGSCTSYNLGYQRIWTAAVVPAAPDAWVWAGDFSYLDDPMLNCDLEEATEVWQRECNCSNSFIAKRPHSCLAGDVDHAQRRWLAQLRDPGYAAFLEYMCPGAAAAGYWPPPGTDLAWCPKSIIGTWDDHDSGWNNDNRRLPSRHTFKNFYLDAVGDPQDSPRRGDQHGLWFKFSLNAFARGTQRSLYQESPMTLKTTASDSSADDVAMPLAVGDVGVDVFLLDERYERETLPCETRRQWCTEYVIDTLGDVWENRDYAWCEDFVRGGADGRGTCCDKDATLTTWCTIEEAKAPVDRSSVFAQLCDYGHERYGMDALRLNNRTGDYETPVYGDTVDDLASDSPFCEMLGRRQRAWFRDALEASSARVKLIVSGSVLLGNPDEGQACRGDASISCPCSGDDWECYSIAKREMAYRIHGAQRPGESCAIVLTGDYHISDFKVLQPGGGTAYASSYDSAGFDHPVVQFMSSGLTDTTATGAASCEDWNADQLGLRPDVKCAFYKDPSFGMLRFESADGELVATAGDRIEQVRMQIVGSDGVVKLEQVVDMDTCGLKLA